MAIPPDPDLAELAIKRAYQQTFTWLRCYKKNIQNIDQQKTSLKLTDGELKPLSFNGD